ncbi:hypothetical protein KR018_004414 [Drosophila ironensis]|nr:hypothetical protein KR018_004414 [Drosophila ironensis]
MHSISSSNGSGPGARPTASYLPCVTFAPGQTQVAGEQRIGPLVAARTAQRRLFYGIEVMASGNSGKPVCLDFNGFLPVLPLFVSIVWLGRRYSDVEPLDEVESLQLAQVLAPRIPVLPHITAYRMSKQRFDHFHRLNFSSVLALRGDDVHSEQAFSLCQPMVERSRKLRGDTLSICVAGYPEGYTSLGGGLKDAEQDIRYLKKKIDAGADCIFTQMCYQHEPVVQFVRRCRAAGIQVPIVVGLMVHESMKMYAMIERIAGIHLPKDSREKLEEVRNNRGKLSDAEVVRQFFVNRTVGMVRHILDADVDVWGLQFYTLNKFSAVQEVLKELRSQKLL